MAERIKEKPVDKDRRKPILEAARAGKTDLIDRAIQGLIVEEIASIKGLLKREWSTLIPDSNRSLLLDRLARAEGRIQASTHKAVAQASGVITPQATTTPPNQEEIDYATLVAENAALRAELSKNKPPIQASVPPAPTPAAQPRPTQAATLPHTSYSPSAPAAQGPSRGTRTTPSAPPTSTYVAEGMRR